MAQTSLQKSHSKASNAKLTFICMLLALFVGALFAGIGLSTTLILDEYLSLAIVIVGAIGTIGMLTSVFLFTR